MPGNDDRHGRRRLSNATILAIAALLSATAALINALMGHGLG